ERYLSENNYDPLRRILAQMGIPFESVSNVSGREIRSGEYQRIVDVVVEREGMPPAHFGLVYASRPSHNDLTTRDHDNLAVLHQIHPGYVPTVYGQGVFPVTHENKTQDLRFFAVEWLQGYRELHLQSEWNAEGFIATTLNAQDT